MKHDNYLGSADLAPPASRVEAVRAAVEIAREMGTDPTLDDVLALAQFLLEDS